MTQYEFGEKLRTFRKEHKLTQKELANKIQMSNTTISSWEDGAKVPNILSILDLCEAFGLSLDDLLGLKKTANRSLKQTRSRCPSKHANSNASSTNS